MDKSQGKALVVLLAMVAENMAPIQLKFNPKHKLVTRTIIYNLILHWGVMYYHSTLMIRFSHQSFPPLPPSPSPITIISPMMAVPTLKSILAIPPLVTSHHPHSQTLRHQIRLPGLNQVPQFWTSPTPIPTPTATPTPTIPTNPHITKPPSMTSRFVFPFRNHPSPPQPRSHSFPQSPPHHHSHPHQPLPKPHFTNSNMGSNICQFIPNTSLHPLCIKTTGPGPMGVRISTMGGPFPSLTLA